MNTNKRFLLAAIVMAAVFAFAGCGGTESDASDKSVADTGSVSNTTDISDTESGNTSGTSEEENTVLTEETDFGALVSEKITEEEWKTAFTESGYESLTVVETGEYGGGTIEVRYLREGEARYMSIKVDDEKAEWYFENSGNGYFEYESDGAEWTRKEISKEEFEDSSFFLYADGFGYDFGDYFSIFSYNEEKKGYFAESYQEPYGPEYTQIVVKIVGGNLAYMEYLCDGDKYELKFFDIGTTAVVFPELSGNDSTASA